MVDKKGRQDDKGEGEGGLFEGREDFLQIFKRGAEFYEELLEENGRLRYEHARVADELGRLRDGLKDAGVIEKLEIEIAQLQKERQGLLSQFKEVEAQNTVYVNRYAEIEEEHNTLANLYIASYQLHSTLSFPEVTRIILEIAINLIGIGRLVLYVLDTEQGKLVPVAGDGIGELFDVKERESVKLGEGVIGQAVGNNERYVADPPQPDKPPLAVIPLVAGQQPVGALVLERFLVQKDSWSQVDFELFTLLGAHAGTALLAASLSSEQPEHKLSADRIRALLVEGL